MSWIYNIIGIIFIGIIYEIFLPFNKISAFMRCVFSIFIVYSLISPLLNYSGTKKISTAIDNLTQDQTSDLIYSINNAKKNSYEILIENSLENDGILNVDVELNINLENKNFDVIAVDIYMQNLVLTESNTNINKYEVITKHVKKYLEISEDKINYFE